MVKIPNGNLGKVHILLSNYNVKYLSVDNVTSKIRFEYKKLIIYSMVNSISERCKNVITLILV